MDKAARVFVAGSRGLVGSALVRRLEGEAFQNILKPPRAELDLMDRAAVAAFYAKAKPDYVFDAAARVGGIHANDAYRADFIHENLQIQINLIDGAYRHGVTKFIFLGSTCIYPKLAPQPMPESSLLTGPLEETNSAYAVAKIVDAGVYGQPGRALRHRVDVGVVDPILVGEGVVTPLCEIANDRPVLVDRKASCQRRAGFRAERSVPAILIEKGEKPVVGGVVPEHYAAVADRVGVRIKSLRWHKFSPRSAVFQECMILAAGDGFVSRCLGAASIPGRDGDVVVYSVEGP